MNIEEEYEELKSKVVERKKYFDDFITFLEKQTTWLTAPASVRYHLSVEKGLLQHSVGVTQTLIKIKNLLAPMLSDESCVIVALFHDVGKATTKKVIDKEVMTKHRQYCTMMVNILLRTGLLLTRNVH